MNLYKIYPSHILARCIDRPNRFVMHLRDERTGEPITAHVPNTGHMTEFLIPGREFALVPTPSNRISWRVVATRYQGNWVFLDTIRCNRIVETLLGLEKIPELTEIQSMRREVSWEGCRFDFLITHPSGQKTWLEVKSVTLCHRGTALFPDAPTERGLKHVLALRRLREQDPTLRVLTLYLILNGSAERFSFNPHTHIEYARASLDAGIQHILVYRLPFQDPVTCDIDGLSPVTVDTVTPVSLDQDRGAYLLILHLPGPRSIRVGALGDRRFEAGYYVYAGSAMNGLGSRIGRHLGKNKKKHWHIDYLRQETDRIRAYPIRSRDPGLEHRLVKALRQTDWVGIPGFGSSDSPHPSHCFFTPGNPLRDPQLTGILFDAYTRDFFLNHHPSSKPQAALQPGSR